MGGCMTHARWMQMKAGLVFALGAIALGTSPNAANAATKSAGGYCFENCVEAVWYMSCPSGQYVACSQSFNCMGEGYGAYAECAYEM
jgi:hypothetical protein